MDEPEDGDAGLRGVFEDAKRHLASRPEWSISSEARREIARLSASARDGDVFTSCTRCGRYAPQPETEGDDSYCNDCTRLINVEYERDQLDLQRDQLRAEVAQLRERLAAMERIVRDVRDMFGAHPESCKCRVCAFLNTPAPKGGL